MNGSDESRAEVEFENWQWMRMAPVSGLMEVLHNESEDVVSAAIQQLHIRGGKEVFDYAKKLVDLESYKNQVLGARILGQLGGGGRPYRVESIPLLLRLLDSSNGAVRAEAVAAMGHLGASQCLVNLARMVDDPDDEVRKSVAFAMGKLGGKDAISVLGRLLRDRNSDVVEWALVGICGEDEVPTWVLNDLKILSGDNDSDIADAAKRILDENDGRRG